MTREHDARRSGYAIPAIVTLAVALGLSAGCMTMPPDGGSGSPGESRSTGGGMGETGSAGETGRPGETGPTGETGNDPSSDEPATTSEERRAVLGRRLDDTLDEFDKTLQDEQRRTAEQRDTRTAATRGVEGDDGSAARTSNREGDLRSERSASAEASDRGETVSGSGAPDRGLPAGDDDDIVARRLRRAAEQETDPELKEKLWKEYADYKRNAQGGG